MRMMLSIATAFQLFVVGSQADTEAAKQMADQCGVSSRLGRHNERPGLYVEKGTLDEFNSPALQCLLGRVMTGKFSHAFGFVGNEAR
jgi:hypothetical protein